MSSRKLHRGVVVPLVTPITATGAIDEGAVRRIVESCVAHQLGIFVLGTTGEAASLSDAKRAQLVLTTVEAAAHRVLVYAGVGDNCVEHTIAAANGYINAGVDAVVAHLPSYYTLRATEMESYFGALAAEIRGSLVLYNIPQATHMSLPLDVVEALSELENVVAFKDSENVAGRPEETMRRFGGRSDFSIFMGAAVLSAHALQLGFDGLVPSSGNLIPEVWLAMLNQAELGGWEAVQTLQTRANQVAQIFQRDRLLGESLAALKALMGGIGLCEAHVLPPLRTLSAPERADLQSQFGALNAI